MAKKEEKQRSIYLFAATIFVFFASPLARAFGQSMVFTDITIFGVLVAGVFAVCYKRRTRILAILLALPSVLLHPLGWMQASRSLQMTAQSFDILFCSFLSLILLKYIFSGRKVNTDKVFAAISLYLLIGILFGLLHRMIEISWPGSYAFP